MHLKPVALLLLFLTTKLCLSTTSPAQTTLSPEEHRRSIVCMGMCSDIQKLCAEDIADGYTAGRDLKDGILDETSCLLMCEADWTDTTLDCVSKADSCSQFFDVQPYCVETEEENESSTPAVGGKGCIAACKNYVKCASYGEGIGPQDKIDAYNTCMQVCPTWTVVTQNCIASTAIRNPADCMAQTACIIGSLNNMMPPKPGRK